MIIGKPLTAGGKGLKPQITVTSKAGSTIDILQSGIILQTYTLGASETTHTFDVDLGTYTVRATLGTQTKSETVLVDEVAQYEVTITFTLYLLRDGVGEVSYDQYYTYSRVLHNILTNPPQSGQATLAYNSNGYLQNYMKGSGYGHTTTLAWNISGQSNSKLKVEVQATATYRLLLYGTSNANGASVDYDFVNYGRIEYIPTDKTVYSIDISSADYILLNLGLYSITPYGYTRIFNVWLE